MIGLFLFASCSHEVAPYDDLVEKGRIEGLVRKKYAGFFKGISQLAMVRNSSEDVPPDSIYIKKAAQLTDNVITDVRQFPLTVDSRLAFDALSYGALDLRTAGSFSHNDVAFFWENALLDPLLTKGREYVKSGMSNESTLLQIVQALQRGMGDKVTNDMLLALITIIGPKPPEKVIEFCRADTLAFKRIYDLIYYSRSLQKYGPPLWMTTGAWFLGVDIKGLPFAFFCLKPIIADKMLYLTFRDYNHGTFYAAVFDDPVPEDSGKMDAWLTRAEAVMSSLTFDDKLAERITRCSLPTYDTHNFYSDYLIYTDADSLKKEYMVTLKRERIHDSPFAFAGVDSITVLFSTKQITTGEGLMTPLSAVRVMGSSMSGGRVIPGRKGEGTAYLIPIGVHSPEMLKQIQEATLPEVKVNTR